MIILLYIHQIRLILPTLAFWNFYSFCCLTITNCAGIVKNFLLCKPFHTINLGLKKSKNSEESRKERSKGGNTSVSQGNLGM